MNKYKVISLKNLCGDTSSQNRNKEPICNEIEGEFKIGQKIEIPDHPNKKWKIIKVNSYIEKGDELPLLFVYDVDKEKIFTMVQHEPIPNKPLTKNQICPKCHQYSGDCICPKNQKGENYV